LGKIISPVAKLVMLFCFGGSEQRGDQTRGTRDDFGSDLPRKSLVAGLWGVLLSLVSSVSAGITSSRHDAHLDKLRPNASHRL
jgi:hypothetical protein